MGGGGRRIGDDEEYIPSSVHVRPLNEAELLPLNRNIVKIEGQWLQELTNNNTEEIRVVDLINITFSHENGQLKWLGRRDECQAHSLFNTTFVGGGAVGRG